MLHGDVIGNKFKRSYICTCSELTTWSSILCYRVQIRQPLLTKVQPHTHTEREREREREKERERERERVILLYVHVHM